jgi:membrane fusion protein
MTQGHMTQELFRRQAIEQQTNRLHGDVLLLPKLSHTLISGLLLVWVIVVLFWLFNSTYARQETVQGWLEPPAGVVRVYAEDIGKIERILVANGEAVVEGQPLLIVNGDRVLADGKNLETLLLGEYETQRTRLNNQLVRAEEIYQMRSDDITHRIAAARKDLTWLDRQIKTLEQRHALVSGQVERYRSLKKAGHLSSADFDVVIEKELALRSERQELAREQVNQRNLIAQLQTEQALLPEDHANTVDEIQAKLSDIAQQIAQLRGQRAYIVKAPRAGVVSNLQAREGQQTRNDIPLLSLVPENARLNAHLLVPVRSAGFVEPGQHLEIRYDAFPYQKFGLYRGNIISVSDTILLPNELMEVPVPIQEPVYRVLAELSQPFVNAYGRNIPLKAGMTLSADVRLSERTLIEWLLEPLYSLKGRL